MTHATLPFLHFFATVPQGWQSCHATNSHSPLANVPDVTSCRIMNTFHVTKYVRSKMTKKVQVSPSRFRPQNTQRCHQSEREIEKTRIGFQMLKNIFRIQGGGNTRIRAVHGTRKAQQNSARGCRKKTLRIKHMRCSVCVRSKENPMRNKALTLVLVLGSGDHLCSDVTQFVQ